MKIGDARPTVCVGAGLARSLLVYSCAVQVSIPQPGLLCLRQDHTEMFPAAALGGLCRRAFATRVFLDARLLVSTLKHPLVLESFNSTPDAYPLQLVLGQHRVSMMLNGLRHRQGVLAHLHPITADFRELRTVPAGRSPVRCTLC